MEEQYSRYQFEERIRSELDPSEQILWSGRGNTRKIVWSVIPQFLFSIPWTVFAVYWTIGATGLGSGFKDGFQWMGLFGVIFVAVGIGMLLTPFIAWKRAGKTFYFLTGQRAIIAVMGKNISLDSSYLNRLENMNVTKRSDGSGDITFGTRKTKTGQDEPFGFLGIPDVSNVERQINAARGHSPEPSTEY